MISKILNISSFKDLGRKIDYNEEKVKEGVAELLLDGTFASVSEVGEKQYLESFKEVINLNKRVNSKLAVEVSLNLTKGELIDNDTFLKIAEDYISEMGYENCPFLVYRHEDKDHSHLHLLISNVDFDGKRVEQFKNYNKSLQITSQIEVKYGLDQTKQSAKKSPKSFREVQARKYYLQNAIKKGLKGYDTKSFLSQIIGEESIKKVYADYLTNTQVETMLGKDVKEITNYLEKSGLFNLLFKDELLHKIDQVLRESKTEKEYFEKLKAKDIYLRKVSNSKGEPTFIYGLKDVSFYVSEEKLSKRFMHQNLLKERPQKQINTNFTVDQQKSYIKNQASKAVRNASSIEQLKKELHEKGIELITYQNKSGIYGLGFKNRETGDVFKASEIDRNLSWANVKESILENHSLQDDGAEFIYEPMEEENYVSETVLSPKSNKEEDEFDKNLRKKKRNKRL